MNVLACGMLQILTCVKAPEPPNPPPPHLLGLCPSAIRSTYTLFNALLATTFFLRARLQALEFTPREQEEIATRGPPSRLPTTAALAIASFPNTKPHPDLTQPSPLLPMVQTSNHANSASAQAATT